MQTGNLVYLTNFNVCSLQTGSQQGQKKFKNGMQSRSLEVNRMGAQTALHFPHSPHSDSSHKTQRGACLQATLSLNYLHLNLFSQSSGILQVTVRNSR